MYDQDFWERFEKRVDRTHPSGCHLWTGRKNSRGYGYIRFRGESVGAHRVALQAKLGYSLGDLFACHHCDTPSCVKDEHLFAGTHADNMQDCRGKGRHLTVYKLTDDDVREIRRLVGQGERQVDLAEVYGVNNSTINRIVSGVRRSAVV